MGDFLRMGDVSTRIFFWDFLEDFPMGGLIWGSNIGIFPISLIGAVWPPPLRVLLGYSPSPLGGDKGFGSFKGGVSLQFIPKG